MTNDSGEEVFFECIGHKDTAPLAVEVIRNNGKAVIVGIFEELSSFNFFSLSGTDKVVIGTLAYTIDDFQGVAQLQASSLITGRIQLQNIVEKGFDELVNNKATNIKINVSPS